MRLASRISLLVAIVIGATATFLVREVLQSIASNAERAGAGTIVVTRSQVAFGAPLTAANLHEVPWRSTEPLEGSFAKVSDLLKDGRRLALSSFQRNEPILVSKVSKPNERATLSTQIEDGMRAVTVRVDEVRGVAGFVLPGDRVDVILTRGEGGAQDASAYADLLVQNAKVLAVDQLVDDRQDKPTVARAVTLALPVLQAQKVILAQGIGRLALTLRQANGADEESVPRVTAGDLGSRPAASPDRFAEIEKRLEEMKTANETARATAERNMAQRLSEVEARLRPDAARFPSVAAVAPAVRPEPPGAVVTVTRNGSKAQSYTVAAER